MFTALIAFFDATTMSHIVNICQKHEEMQLVVANTLDDWDQLYRKQDYNCFMFHFDQNFNETRNRIEILRSKTHHAHTPILIFSTRIEYLVSAFVKWRSCEYFFLPMDEEKSASLRSLLHFYDEQHKKIHASENNFCQIHTGKGIYNIPRKEILFAESTMKKSIVHLRGDELHLPFPLYRVKEQLVGDCFVQTHRSFIVNTNNISFIDKSKESWGIFFFDSNKEAFVSRNHKKDLPAFFTNNDEDSPDEFL